MFAVFGAHLVYFGGLADFSDLAPGSDPRCFGSTAPLSGGYAGIGASECVGHRRPRGAEVYLRGLRQVRA